jgi:serine/threonine-protein kinase HipA
MPNIWTPAAIKETSWNMIMSVVSATFNRMAEAVTETRAVIPVYIADNPEFKEIGKRLMASWNEGVKGLMG